MTRKRSGSFGRFFRRLVLVTMVLGGLSYWWYYAAMTSPLDDAGERVVITIESGANYDDAVAVLLVDTACDHTNQVIQ